MKKPGFIVIGLALFSMFFGSGNLIFPLVLGRDAGYLFPVSALGFIISAVLIPCFGALAIALAEGDYEKIFGTMLPMPIARVLIFIVLLSFIPLGAGPRCVILAHASLNTFLPMPSLWLFAIIFLLIVLYLVNDRLHLIDILGKVLTPLLLISIGIIVAFAMMDGVLDEPSFDKKTLFWESLLEGYNTQDLMSSLFFSSSLILLIKSSFKSSKELVKAMLQGTVVGIVLLAFLYCLLIAAASFHSQVLVHKSGVELVSVLAHYSLGSKFGLVAGLAVALACLTTAVALVMAFNDFLSRHFFQRSPKISLAITVLSIFLTSLLEFDGLMAIINPLMQVIYPVILMVVIFYLWQYNRGKALR